MQLTKEEIKLLEYALRFYKVKAINPYSKEELQVEQLRQKLYNEAYINEPDAVLAHRKA